MKPSALTKWVRAHVKTSTSVAELVKAAATYLGTPEQFHDRQSALWQLVAHAWDEVEAERIQARTDHIHAWRIVHWPRRRRLPGKKLGRPPRDSDAEGSEK